MSIKEIPEPPTDTISSLQWSPDGGVLLVSSWDGQIHVYTKSAATDGGSATLQRTALIRARGAVLDIAWHADSGHFFAVGLEQDVLKYNLAAPQVPTVLSSHDKPSNKVQYSQEHDLVISTSWDETMHVHEPNSSGYLPVKLAGKPVALAVTSSYVVVAMTARKVHVYDLAALKLTLQQAGGTDKSQASIEVHPWQQRESSLKFMTRDLACMPDGTGFASSSIEGRVGVEWFDEELNKQAYAFKCHREKTTVEETNENGENTSLPCDVIYPVNAVAFHPVHGTFATGGGDGVIALWDAKTKRRIRQYPKLPSCVAQMSFSPDGRMFAIGISPGFEDGNATELVDPALVKIYVRELGETEAKGKAAKEKAPKEET